MLVQKMKLLMFMLALAAGAVLQSGCGDDTIRLTTSPLVPGVLVLNPQKSQTIHWSNVTPTFSQPSPCETDPTNSNPECKINQDSGLYLYHCGNNQCTDPEVVVGPDSTKGMHTLAVAATSATADPVSLYCNNNQVALDPIQLNITASANQQVVVTWASTGNNSQKISYPQVTFKSANPSSPLPACITTGPGGPYPYVSCQFNAPAQSTVYGYWAQSSNNECSGNINQNGKLNLTIQ